VQHTDDEIGKVLITSPPGQHPILEQVRQQDQALFVHGLFRDEVSDFKQSHRSSPEDNQTGMGNVSTEQFAR